MTTTTYQLNAYRQSETLILAVYEVTDTFPRDAEPRLLEGMRELTTIISTAVLEGCSREQPEAAARAWRAAVGYLEALGESIDLADARGYLAKDQTLELLENQSGTLVDVLTLLEEQELNPRCSRPVLPLAA